MKKAVSKDVSEKEDMKSEYDFSKMKGAVRGKYYKAYRAGHKVEILRADGTTSIEYFTLKEGAVMLEPDVRKYFSSSESVNKALRSLIAIISPKRRTADFKGLIHKSRQVHKSGQKRLRGLFYSFGYRLEFFCACFFKELKQDCFSACYDCAGIPHHFDPCNEVVLCS